jgi:putative glutathione S-transferase
MGMLIDGKWHDQWYDTNKTGGRFVRGESAFRNRVITDGSSAFPPNSDATIFTSPQRDRPHGRQKRAA